MRIALLTPTFSKFSGIDRLVERKAEELAAKGNEVTIYALAADMKPARARLAVIGMPKQPFLQRIYRLLFFLDFPKVSRYACEVRNYDAAISFFYPMNIIASKARKNYGVKYVYVNAGVADPRLFGFLEGMYLRIFNWLCNATIKNADELYSISDYLRKQLRTETGRDSRVEYVPIDKKRFNRRVKGVDARKKYRLKPGEKIILYVGRISPHKGVHLLIRAFNRLHEKMPNTMLIIAGKHTFDTYSKQLKSLAGSSVIFAGYVPDEELPKYYAASDLYATGSLWEGYDIPACEAQACGKKVVAFDVGSHREVVKKGRLVEAGNVEKFADAMMELLK